MHSRSFDFRFMLALILLTTLFVLGACGSDEQETNPTPTLVPTLPPVDIAEAEPATHTPIPVATATLEASPTPEETPATVSETEDGETDDTEVAPRVYFRQPTNNAVVPITSTVVMGFEGLVIAPAGEVVEGSGHFHILVDTDFVEPGEVIINDEQHLHFGDGSVETELILSPGSHTLRLQFADGAHRALEGEQYRDEIVVSVKDSAPEQSVAFAQPRDGATVPPEFMVVMAATGLVVEPSGDIHENAGHMHILVNTDFVDPGEVIINDEQHLHFGGGQTTTTLNLEPGEHILRLQMADGAHIALDGEQYRDEIRVVVEEEAPAEQVRFVEPQDGSTVSPTFNVQMTAAGLFVESSGAVLRTEGGHMHILVDTDFVEPGEVIVNDEQHLHFGGGQLTTELTLEPGEHTLRLQMANGAHIALDGAQYQDEITITVDGSAAGEPDTSAESNNDGEATEPDDGQQDDNDAEDGDAAEEAMDEQDDATEDTDEASTPREPQVLWVSLGCSGCHNIDEAQTESNRGPVGPHQGNLHERAGERVEGQSAEEYVYTSIVEPNAYVVEGYVENVMIQTYQEQMSEEEIRLMVKWMLDPNRTQ
ncbi:DUF4399 domain-containing protein [Chloroflexi bacterium TSY]|nr:DUF4399 domain-containing protein [Chloroflexi bacterium TSY]